MARLALEPSSTLARLLRQRRMELGWSLREVQERTEALGHSIPFTTLAKVERGKVDPGVKRLHVLLKVYDLPPQLAHDLLDLEQFAGALPPRNLSANELYEQGVRLWQAGNSRGALAHLLALRGRTVEGDASADRHRALLSFAIFASSMGKFRLSRHLVEDLLVEPLEPDLLVSVLIQAATCWHWTGSNEAALGFLDRARVHVAPGKDRQLAWLHHSRASILASMGQGDDAMAEAERAIEAYRRAGDAYGECRARGVPIRVLLDRADAGRALELAREAGEHARAGGFERLAIMRRIDEGKALVELGESEAGLSTLIAALSEAIAAQDPNLQFYTHYYLWKAYLTQGDPARAELNLRSAEFYVGYVDENSAEAVEVRERVHRRSRSPRKGDA